MSCVGGFLFVSPSCASLPDVFLPIQSDAWIKMQLAATPNRSCYAFGLDRKHPGYFVLAFLAKQGGTIQNWVGRVFDLTPTSLHGLC